MTNEEQEWVDALTGKAIESASTGEQLLASSVRKAFLARREILEADALNFEPEKLELIRRKLNQAGLINGTQQSRKKSNFFDLIIGIVSIKSGQAAVQKVGILVVILLIGFAISNTYLSNRADDPMLYIGARFNRAIECMVLESPEQYLWVHRRWKSRPSWEREGKPMPDRVRRKLLELPWMDEASVQAIADNPVPAEPAKR